MHEYIYILDSSVELLCASARASARASTRGLEATL